MHDRELGKRINLLRYLLVAGVVLLHVPPYVALAELGANADAFSQLKAFFQSALFRLAVPSMACISAFLLFTGPTLPFLQLLKKKALSVALPLLVWNGAAFAVLYGVGAMSAAENSVVAPDAKLGAYPFDALRTLDGLIGFSSGATWNYPLNFLRDLLVLIALSPVIKLLLKVAPYPGFIAWSAVFYFDVDAMLVTRAGMPIAFYLGALAATQRWNLRRFDRFSVWAALGLLLISAAVVHFRIGDQRLLRALSPLLVWPAVAGLVDTRVGAFMSRHADKSFFIFVSHAFALKFYSIVFDRYLPAAPVFMAWAIMAPLTIATCHVAHTAIRTLAPELLSWLVGRRVPLGRSRPPLDRAAFAPTGS